MPTTALEALAEALRTWQRSLGNQLMTTYYIDKAEEPAQLMLDVLLALPVEQRMEAMGMVEADYEATAYRTTWVEADA